MTRIKICGLTRPEDALLAASLGADALGFVFAPRSKRLADPEAVAAIVEALPPFVTTVGVFQDQPAEEVRSVMARSGLVLAQLHGSEDEGYIAALGLPALKAIPIGSAEDLEKLSRYPSQGCVLLDSASGGSGIAFDWALAKLASARKTIVLAGGLNPTNVGEAIAAAHPWAVDVAGGVESSPGVKDSHKLKEFFKSVRAVDALMEKSDDA